MSYRTVREVIKVLQENGFQQKSQSGSHIKFEKDGRIVIVPAHGKKGVEKGTYYNILRQAGLK
ncbi:MAG: type II toxin-antitoxin system HicA family toxin [Bacteroidales bacterium]|nr:type II toxin-antitoxin system HicA family toxin [Bacteroidales bacterium]